jgi:hypothetical protein
MIWLMIAGDNFATGGIHGVQMSAMLEDGINSFRHRTGLHLVVADGFATDGKAEDGAELFGGDVGRETRASK